MPRPSKKPSISRRRALTSIAALPFVALGATAAQAADNKKQFKYQDKPGKNGQKCSGCRLFKPPNACKVVTGRISPNGWCIAWSKR
jgi:high potential iron-sulfur protein